MQFDECILNRRSVRKFEDKPIPKEIIEEIITAGMYAPSACNFQAWKFICVTDHDKKRNLDNRVLENAPVAIIVCYRRNLWFSGRMHYDYIQSASAAIQNILLYSYGKGLGGVWICAYPKAALMRKYFNIPKSFLPVGCVALGYPLKGCENNERAVLYHYGDEESYKKHKRKYSINETICWDSFTQVDGDCSSVRGPSKIGLAKVLLKSFIKRILPKKIVDKYRRKDW